MYWFILAINNTLIITYLQKLALAGVTLLGGIIPQIKMSPIQFLVKAHPCVVGSVPGQGT